MEHDKYKSCIDCPDRVADPNCHGTCKGYIHRQQERAKLNESRLRTVAFNEYKSDVVERTKRRHRSGGLRARKKNYD